MLIAHVFAEGSVKPLDGSMLIGFACLDVLSIHTIVLAPLFECFTEKFRAIVRADAFGQAMVALDLHQDAHQARGVDRGIDRDVHTPPIEVVNDIEGAQAPTTSQGIADEID